MGRTKNIEEPKVIKGYKAFNKGLICNNYKFEEGKEFEEKGEPTLCRNGFHFCKNPLDVLDYYNLCESEFAEVEAIGNVKTEGNKSVTNKIKIGAKLGLKGFIKASFDFIWESSKANKIEDYSKANKIEDYSKVATSGYSSKVATSGDYSQVATSGDYSQVATSGYSSKVATSGYSSKVATSGYSSKVATSGYYSKVATSGDYSQVATSGDYSKVATSGYSSKVATSGYSSKVATSGDYSQVATSGYSSKVELKGMDSVGAAIGIEPKIKATLGCWITLAEWKYDGEKYIPLCVKSSQIDGEILKPDTWYMLKNGEFVEA